jgi:Excreted virulence factor EspC, type VII ESX diderm
MTSDWDRVLNPFRYDSQGNLTDHARQRDQELTLDHVAPEPGGSTAPAGPVLKVTPSLLRDRAGKAETVAGDFKKADDSAMAKGDGTTSKTGAIAAGLRGFRCAGAFSVFEERWNSQMTYVTGMLRHGVADALRSAAADHEKTDIHTANDQGQG